jgi:sec-independent protein translocase protein TatC
MTIPFLIHLKEFKFRFFYLIITWLFLVPVLYYFGDPLLFLLIRPKTIFFKNNAQTYFIFTNITEAFQTYLELALYFSTFLCFPIFIYHLFLFIIPGLYNYEKKIIKQFINIGVLTYIICILFIYYIIIPISWEFFSSFELNSTENLFNLYFETKLNEYLSYIMKIFFIFGLLFQFCLFFCIYLTVNKTTYIFLVNKRRYIYLICFFLAALITPPDFFSQLLIGIPLIILYELHIFWLIYKKNILKYN